MIGLKRKNKYSHVKNHVGFTLLEVLISMTILALFATAFISGMGYNLLDSGGLKDDIKLKDLAENKINEIIINPPEFREALTLSKETKTFEKDENYEYSVQWKKLTIPDMTKIRGGGNELSQDGAEDESADGGQNSSDSQTAMAEKKIYETFKTNIEKMVWQVEVQVKNKTSKQSFTISSWLYNDNADVQINGI